MPAAANSQKKETIRFVNTAALKNKGFMVKEFDGYVLVHPSRGKWDWAPDELGLRSVIFDAAGRLVSSGWPKFFNQNEWPDHDAVIAAELAFGRALITHKHDGSLIIRSVLPDGRILFRTRDTFDGGKFAPLAEAVARAKYPALLDPTVFADGSLLFEYVGGGNQIVVRYHGEDDLVLLGAARHNVPEPGRARYLAYPELESVAGDLGLNLVETYPWAEMGIAGVLAQVQDWDRAEGVVVRSGDGQTLLKIKSAWYFAQHALRWHMTYESICRFALDGGIEDEDALTRKLAEAGWDWETSVTAREHFARYQAARREAKRIREIVTAYVADFDRETAGVHDGDERARRKAFASRVFGPGADSEARALASYQFLAYDNKQSQLDATLLRNVVLRGGSNNSNKG